MKRNSAFVMCLIIVILFGALTGLSVYLNIDNGSIAPFFGACTLVFTMLLPMCSTTR